jgi:hypothetical protein
MFIGREYTKIHLLNNSLAPLIKIHDLLENGSHFLYIF